MSSVPATKRIDAGVPRGPREPKVQRRPGPGKLRRNPATGKVQAIPPDLDPKEVLARYLSEDTTSQIAQSYGVTRKSLVAWLREVEPKAWKHVQLIRAHDRKEFGNEGLESAEDALSLARAREIVKSAQWELAALDDDYRPKLAIENKEIISDETKALMSQAQELLTLFREKVVNPAPEPQLQIDNAPLSDSER